MKSAVAYRENVAAIAVARKDSPLLGEQRSTSWDGRTCSSIRYAQCWEDADVLLDAARVKPGDTCLSIASGGENTFALLLGGPSKVVTIDTNPAQLALVELKMAAFSALSYDEMLHFLGIVPCLERLAIYAKLRDRLSAQSRKFWDARPEMIAFGILSQGKFEKYFEKFRRFVLPLVHSRPTVKALLTSRSRENRDEFYKCIWNTRAWRGMFKLFFSRFTMGLLGRSPEQFQFVDGPVADRIMGRTAFALTHLAPSANPYLHWILTGTFGSALPVALRPENFEIIKRNLHKIELRLSSVEEALVAGDTTFDVFNLSDIFEYMSKDEYKRHIDLIVQVSNPNARLVYWNMLVPRRSGTESGLTSNRELSSQLFVQDKAFFYSDLVIEEVRK